MSDTVTLPPQLGSNVVEDKTVPAEEQKRLQDYWRQFGPNRGAIIPAVDWDGGGTAWDQGATIWVS